MPIGVQTWTVIVARGSVLMSLLGKIWLILTKTVKNLIFMDFCAVHPLKGKVTIYFFIFCIKIMSRDLGFCPDRYEILFFSQKKYKP